MIQAIRRWWTRRVWLRYWRRKYPRLRVISDAPRWTGGIPVEVLRLVYSRGDGRTKRVRNRARLVKFNPKTAVLSLYGGGYMTTRHARVSPRPVQSVRVDYDQGTGILFEDGKVKGIVYDTARA